MKPGSRDPGHGHDGRGVPHPEPGQRNTFSKRTGPGVRRPAAQPPHVVRPDGHLAHQQSHSYSQYHQTPPPPPEEKKSSLGSGLLGGLLGTVVAGAGAAINSAIDKVTDQAAENTVTEMKIEAEEMQMSLEEQKLIAKLPAHCPHCGAPTGKSLICEYCDCKIPVEDDEDED